MFNKKKPNDLTEEEIWILLSAKRRFSSQKRLERFRRTGRLIDLVPDVNPTILETLYPSHLNCDEEEDTRVRSLRDLRRPTDLSLLLIEIVVILVFLYFVVNGIGLHHVLNRRAAVGLEVSNLTPTPLISAIVLPSGHVHTTSTNGSQPNDAEIPEHLRPLVQSQAILPIPTPAPQHGIRIQIPAIDVDAPVVHGDGWEQLKKGVAHRAGSADPGQLGNIVLSGHNDIFGEVFRYLEKLKPGDEIIVYTSQRPYTYIVSGWELVEPTQVDVLAPTSNATITLISCHPYLVDNHRIIVKGSLEG